VELEHGLDARGGHEPEGEHEGAEDDDEAQVPGVGQPAPHEPAARHADGHQGVAERDVRPGPSEGLFERGHEHGEARGDAEAEPHADGGGRQDQPGGNACTGVVIG
jgi:hypothetical protein